MKKQMMKSLVAVVSVAALSLGIFPGGGIAEDLGVVTESKAAEEYETVLLDSIGLPGSGNKETVEQWVSGLGILEDTGTGEMNVIEAAFEKAAKTGLVKPYRNKTEVHSLSLQDIDEIETLADDKNSIYIWGYYIDDYDGSYVFETLRYFMQEGNSSGTVTSYDEIAIVFNAAGKVESIGTFEDGANYYLFRAKSSSSTASSSSTPAAPSNHQHAYEWQILTDPTIDEDGVYAYICSCGDIKEKQPISAAQVFVKDLYGKVKEAPQNGTVIYDAKSWSTISDYLLKKMAERNDVTVTIRFQYQKADYEITFPAGTDYTAVLNDTETMYGFFGIANILGLEVKAL